MPLSDQGIHRDRYHIIPRVLIFASHGENILLLKGSPTKKLWANLYNGIGGHIEKGESIIDAAHREFQEETGLKLISPWLCAIATIDTKTDLGIGMFVFRGSVEKGEIASSEEGTPEWISIEEFPKLPLVEDLPVLVPKIFSLNLGDTPIFAQYTYTPDDKLSVDFIE